MEVSPEYVGGENYNEVNKVRHYDIVKTKKKSPTNNNLQLRWSQLTFGLKCTLKF